MTNELECNCIMQNVSFFVKEKKSRLRNIWDLGMPDFYIPLTIHAENLTDLETKIESMNRELQGRYPNAKVWDNAR